MPDVTRREVTQKINEALDAIQRYKNSATRFEATGSAAVEKVEMEKRARVLLAEARWIGSSGDSCKRCNGSGIEPGT